MTETKTAVPSLLQILALNPARDAEGRALLESAADQKALDEIQESLVTCDYEDSPSRLGHEKPMNTGALEQAKRNFAGMLAVLRHLRGLHLASLPQGTPTTTDDWRRICILGEVLPRFLYLRNHLVSGASSLDDYYGYEAPADVSTLFKTVRGLAKALDYIRAHPSEVAARMPKEMAGRLQIPKPKSGTKKGAKGKQTVTKPLTSEGLTAYRAAQWTVDDLIWAAETFDLFVGETEVCAAPTNMVRATLGSLLDGTNPHEEIELSKEMLDLLGDGAAFLRFATTLDALYHDLGEFRVRVARSVTKMMEEVRGLSPGQHGRALAIHLDGIDRYLIAERRFLERCRTAQADLLAAAGYDAPSPELDLALIDRILPDNRRNLAFRSFGVRVEHREGAIDVSIESGGQSATETVPYSPE